MTADVLAQNQCLTVGAAPRCGVRGTGGLLQRLRFAQAAQRAGNGCRGDVNTLRANCERRQSAVHVLEALGTAQTATRAPSQIAATFL